MFLAMLWIIISVSPLLLKTIGNAAMILTDIHVSHMINLNDFGFIFIGLIIVSLCEVSQQLLE